MYWEEKIDLVKKEYPAPLFKDPFRQGGAIIEKIIRNFHNATYLTFVQSDDKRSLMKNCKLIKETAIIDVYQKEIDKLDENTNYWLLLIQMPMGEGIKVYDCQKEAISYILYLASGLNKLEFYIADKKYNWLTYFNIDRSLNTASIYKSGETKTVFDE